MKMKFTFTLILSIIVAFSFVLYGCSGSKSGDGDSTGSTGGGSEDKVTLNVALWDESVKDTLNQVIAIYKKDHPNVDVKVTYTPWSDYWTKLKTSLAGKSGPDVFWMNGPNIYAYTATGLLKNIQPLVKQDQLDMSQYTQALVDLYTYKNDLYGMPYFLDSIGLFYNKELFDQAKLPYPDSSWTWDTLEEVGQKLTDKSKGTYGFIAPVANQSGYYNLIAQAGGFVISPDKKQSGFDQPESIEAFKWMMGLMDKGISPNAQQQLETDPLQLFGSGKAAMFPAISVRSSALFELLGDKLGVAPLPAGKQKATIVHGLSWVMSNNTAHEEEAWELIKAFSGEEGETLLADSGFSIPALKGTENGWLNSIPSLDLQVFIDSLEFGVSYPVSQKTAEWQDVEAKEIQNALLNKKPIEDAVKTVAEQMNQILAGEK